MSAPKPLSQMTLPEREVIADRKKAKKYDMWGLGEKAIYVGGTILPRQWYVPYERVTHVFRRVAVSPGTGKGFLTPVLYMVVRYDDGQEKQCQFKYINDADEMIQALEQKHPEIKTVSPGSEAELAERARIKEERDNAVLEGEAERAVRKLENAREILEKRPSLYQDLAGRAKQKRSSDLIKPGYEVLTVGLLLAGLCMIVGGIWGMMALGLSKTMTIFLVLAGGAVVFLMLNSKIMPLPSRNRRTATRNYEKALNLMQHHINSYQGFPLPVTYAHPVVATRMIRILKEGRAHTMEEALSVLKEDLKQTDHTVQLQRDDYAEVVAIKPLFTVRNYQ